MESQNLLALSFSWVSTLLYVPVIRKKYGNSQVFQRMRRPLGGVANVGSVATMISKIDQSFWETNQVFSFSHNSAC